MMKKKVGCELCDSLANMYCESDRANLCWGCDNKVHGANFLAAKHTRNVLCHLCQATTPWFASGPSLPPAMSLCLSCVATTCDQQSVESCIDHDHDHDHDLDHDESSLNGDYEEDCYSDDEDEDEEEHENQVVPLTSSNAPPLSGVAAASSNSSDDEDEDEDEDDSSEILSMLPPSLKRTREIAFFQSSQL